MGDHSQGGGMWKVNVGWLLPKAAFFLPFDTDTASDQTPEMKLYNVRLKLNAQQILFER